MIAVLTQEGIIQGSAGAAHASQAGMYDALGDFVFQNVLVWIADLLVYFKDCEDLLVNLENVFRKLREFNIELTLKKSVLGAGFLVCS